MRRCFFLLFTLAGACGGSPSDPSSTPPSTDAPAPPGQSPPASTTPPGAAAPRLDLTAGTKVLFVRRGGSASVPITVARVGFDDVVNVTVSGLPAGVTAAPVAVPASVGAATIVFSATNDAAIGKTDVTIDAASGKLAAHAALGIVVGNGGSLDPSFGTGGIVTLQKPDDYLAASSVGVQSDSKIVVGVGWDTSTTPPHPTGGAYRFTDVGAVDTSFGTGGLALVPALGAAFHVAIQPDDKILLCGPAKSASQLVVARLTTTGALDATFGSGGVVTLAENVADTCAGMALDASGRILVASETSTGSPSFLSHTVVARFLPTGASDTSFGTAGVVSTLLGGTSTFPTAFLLTPTSIFLGASRAMGSSEYDGIVARLGLDGTLDTTFATGGVYSTKYQAFEVLPLPGGAVYYALQNQYYKLTATGALDTSFGTGGELPDDHSLTYPFMTSTVDETGRLYRFRYDGEPSYVGAVYAYAPDGSPDVSFGTGGFIDLKPDEVLSGEQITIGPDGRLVALASSGETFLYLARFLR